MGQPPLHHPQRRAQRPAGLRSGVRSGPRPRGIALLMSLVVVMLLSFFMSEYFFATGLELRSMTTFKDAQQARMLSRSVLKAVQIAMLQDEVDFFTGYRQFAGVLEFSAIPWNNGLLLTLQVQPQDHLFNLNNMEGSRPGQDNELCRYTIFRHTADQIIAARGDASKLPPDTPEPDPDALYAAVFDWLDGDDELHVGIPGVLGAESGSYFNLDPEYDVKNAQLDRLTEVRLVRGSGMLLWGEWLAHFTALPKAPGGEYCNQSERVNVNTASTEEIRAFLDARYVDPGTLAGSDARKKQEYINNYAEHADELAQTFAPASGERQNYDQKSLKALLTEQGYTDSYGEKLLSTVNEYYRVVIVTEVAGVRARLEGLLHLPRDPTSRMAKGTAEVLWLNTN